MEITLILLALLSSIVAYYFIEDNRFRVEIHRKERHIANNEMRVRDLMDRVVELESSLSNGSQVRVRVDKKVVYTSIPPSVVSFLVTVVELYILGADVSKHRGVEDVSNALAVRNTLNKMLEKFKHDGELEIRDVPELFEYKSPSSPQGESKE